VSESDNKVIIVDRRLVGVPFYQTFTDGHKREIVCHGPRGIYGSLIDKAKAKWPAEAQ
jgi:hypothetical protein